MEKQALHGEKDISDKSATLLPSVVRQKTQEVYSRLPRRPGSVAPQLPLTPSKGKGQSDEADEMDYFATVVLGQEPRQRLPTQKQDYGTRHGIGYGRRNFQERPGDIIVPIWPKTGAPITKRLQDKLDNEAEKPDQTSEFLRPPASAESLIVGYYFWYDTNFPPSKLLGKNLGLLDDVRVKSKSFIDYDVSTGHIRVRSHNQENVEDAINGIKAKIQHARANEAKLAPIILIEPPSAAVMKTNLEPKFGATRNLLQQPIVEKVLLSGSSLAPEQLATWEIERESIMNANHKHLKEYVMKTYTSLKVLDGDISMRVHFGHLRLLLYKKDFGSTAYSFEKFSQMMRHNRTRTDFEKTLGDSSITAGVLKWIENANEFLIPLDSQTVFLAEIKPKHSLVILACLPSQQQFRVESDFEMLADKRNMGEQGSNGVVMKIGTTQYYRYDSHKTHCTIQSIGFENNFTWCLEMVTNKSVSPPPQLQRLIQNGLSNAVVQRDSNFLDYPSIALQHFAGLQIDKAWVKSTLEYRVKDSPYILEVAIRRGVKTHLPYEELETTCGIMLYHKAWDLLLGPACKPSYRQDWSEDKFFPSSSGAGAGIANFTAKIKEVQTCLDRISGANF